MQTSLLFISALLLIGIGSCTHPEVSIPPKIDDSDATQAFEKKLDRLRQTLRIPGMSVAVLHAQKIVFKKGFGYADVENRIPATAMTSYHLASLTKPFSAAVLMRLVEDGQLRLDDELSLILKETNFVYGGYRAHGYADLCKKIRRLAWRYGELLRDYRCHTNRILVKHHLTHTSQGLPGERYKYNGFLFSFLTDVAETISGKPFDELLVEKIIAPLEMTDTVPGINRDLRGQTLIRRANYYRTDSFGRVAPSTKQPLELSASAGMISTVIDIAKFDVAMDRNLILSRATTEIMFSPTVSLHGNRLPYGIGWFVQDYQGMQLIWHYGHVPKAYSSLIIKIPASELTMILLANSDGASRDFNLGKGDVLNSPFARLFIDHFAGIKKTVR